MDEKSYDEIFSLFEEISNGFKRKNQYFDILYDCISSVHITKSPSAENISLNNKTSGIVARTFLGMWKEIASDNLSDIKKIQESIPKVSNMGDKIAEFEGWTLNEEIIPKKDSSKIPVDKKLEKIREIYEYVQNFDNRIIRTEVRYIEFLIERIFSNNEGCLLRQVIPRIKLYIIPIAREGAVVDYDYYVRNGEIGFEIFDEITTEKLDMIAQNSLDMLKAIAPPTGRSTVILDPSLTGLIAHESFGHGLEADQVLRERSYLKQHLNKKVASDICKIYDTPSLSGPIGSYFFDDEGIRAGKNILVEDGILKNFIYDRRSGSEFNAIPQGNGRRESFAHPINVRMSNTYFEPGDHELDEMISGIQNGVMLTHSFFGMEDPIGGGMQGTSKKGYLIEKGEKTKILRSVALSGSVLELLQNIDAISKDTLKLDGGTCGKGSEDLIPVSSGGSYIRVNNAIISQG
ncbi:MAG: TldD/PmbA family protein [Promethearchaeota archaeon]|jgi:TldD protein